MDAKLSVEVGAKIDELNQKMAQGAKVVSDFAVSADNSLKNVDRSFKILNNTKFTFGANYESASRRLANEAVRTGGILGGSFTKGAQSANIAVMELSRGIQDAPYGSMGYINNLQQFQQLFQGLVQQTGSFKGALKALGSSLIGPAGIGVAFSVVTAAITVYSMWQQKVDRETNKAAKTNDEYADSLDAVSQAQLKGSQSAQKDLVELTLLYKQTQNVTLSTKQRLQAVNELQSKYPAYFANIKDEAFLAGAAAGKYNELTNAILASAKARAATDLIVKNQSRKLEDEQKIIDLQKEELKLYNSLYIIKQREEKLEKERARNGSGGNAGIGSSQGMGFAREKAELEGKIAENRRLQNNYATDISIIDSKNLQLTKSINAETKKGLLDTGKGDSKATGKTAIDIKQERLNLYIKGLEALQKMEGQAVEKLRDDIGKQMPSTTPLITMDSILQKNMPRLVAQELSLINFELIAFNEKAADIINNSLVGTFEGIGNAIGEALSGGQNLIEGLSQTLLSGLGNVLVDLGKLAIATGVGIKAIKTAFKTLNPLVAIGAGVALIALGSSISKSVSKLGDSKLPGFATGVQNFKGGMAIVGERGPEIVNLPQGSDVIPNHKTKGMFSDGGGGFIAETRVELESLWIGLRKVEKHRLNLG